MTLTRPSLYEILLAVVGVLYGCIGVASAGVIRVLGLLGAVVVIAAAVLARRRRRVALMLLPIGVVPLAALTWWSIVTPLLAVVAVLVAIPTLRTHPTRSPDRGHEGDRARRS